MARINRRYIDKHWIVFVLRGSLALVFGCLALFGALTNLETVIAMVSMFLLAMGIVDSVGALYNSTKKHGWTNSVVDALIDVVASLALLFFAKDLIASLIIIATYTFVSGIIDIFHCFLSTVDPTDRFIRALAGIMGCLVGFVILNAGSFELMTFIRFFGVYMLIVGTTSMIYGIHNRSQDVEDKVARSESAKKNPAKKVAKKRTRKK